MTKEGCNLLTDMAWEIREQLKEWEITKEQGFDPIAAEAMLGCMVWGINADRVAKNLGRSRKEIRSILRKMRQGGIIVGTKMHIGWCELGSHGYIAFVCDCLVVEGHLCREERVSSKKKYPKYPLRRVI